MVEMASSSQYVRHFQSYEAPSMNPSPSDLLQEHEDHVSYTGVMEVIARVFFYDEFLNMHSCRVLTYAFGEVGQI